MFTTRLVAVWLEALTPTVIDLRQSSQYRKSVEGVSQYSLHSESRALDLQSLSAVIRISWGDSTLKVVTVD